MNNGSALIQSIDSYRRAVDQIAHTVQGAIAFRPQDLAVIIAEYVGGPHGPAAIDAIIFGDLADFGLMIASIVQYLDKARIFRESVEMAAYDQMVRNYADFVPYELGDPTPLARLDIASQPEITRLCSLARATSRLGEASDMRLALRTRARIVLFYKVMCALYGPPALQ
jgi:hypothetical protein